MMKGAKTAMTSAVLLWRGNNNDLQRRMGDIRLAKEENGIWARYLGGKNKIDKQNTYLKQTYDIAQVGYDKKKGNWTIGAASGLRNRKRHLCQWNRERKTGKFGIVRSHAERRRTVP